MSEENMTEARDQNDPGVEGVDFAPGKAETGGPNGKGTEEREQAAAEQASSEQSASGQDGAADEARENTPVDPLEAARREIQELKDNWTRERAEFMNFRKRAQSERARLRVQAVADFVQGLIPALDNMDTVLRVKTENQEVTNFVTGVRMIQQEMVTHLGRNNIKRVETENKSFDPNFMEAIASEDREDLNEEKVLEVFQNGFYMEFEDGHKQVLRPARVKVGKPAGAAAARGAGD